MMEVLTKKFWLDVKKVFDEARAEPPKASDPPALAEGDAKDSSPVEVPASKEGSSL
jgi:hypothetical protein